MTRITPKERKVLRRVLRERDALIASGRTGKYVFMGDPSVTVKGEVIRSLINKKLITPIHAFDITVEGVNLV